MADTFRKLWSRQQQALRRALMSDRDFVQALPVFLVQHESVHAARLRAGPHWSCQDEVLRGLTFEQMRHLPKGSPHSIAWTIWHIARIEDVTMNILLAGSAQVLNGGGWLEKMGLDRADVGNEMSGDDVLRLSRSVNLKALLAYRLAVARRTRTVVAHLRPASLWEYPSAERLKRIAEEGAVGHQAFWLLKYWGEHPCANLLLMPATRHCFVHLNEIRRLLPALRAVR